MMDFLIDSHPAANTLAIAALALFVIASTFVSPLILARWNRRDKAEDFRRQDEVARQAREAAALLLAEQKNTARLLLENNKVVAQSAAGVKSDLQAIHSFVNSDKTEAMVRELALLREIVALRKQGGEDPGPDILAEIAKLEEVIASRLETTKSVERQRSHQAKIDSSTKQADQAFDVANRLEQLEKEIGTKPLAEP